MSDITQLITHLSNTADTLRGCTPEYRATFASIDPEDLTRALTIATTDQEDATVKQKEELVLQTARVVANLIVDDDTNRLKVQKTGYISLIHVYLKTVSRSRRNEKHEEVETFGTIRAVVASLLNLSLGNISSIQSDLYSLIPDLLHLSSNLYLPVLSRCTSKPISSTSSTAENPNKESISKTEEEGEEVMSRLRVVEWIWKVFDEVVLSEENRGRWEPGWFDLAFKGLEGFLGEERGCWLPRSIGAHEIGREDVGRASQDDEEEDEDEDEEDDQDEIIAFESHYLASVQTLLSHTYSNQPDTCLALMNNGGSAGMLTLLRFIEGGRLPASWSKPLKESGEKEEFNPGKFFGMVKAGMMGTVLEVLAGVEVGGENEWVLGWIRRWIGESGKGREDLRAAGWLVLGNWIVDDRSVRFISQDSQITAQLSRTLAIPDQPEPRVIHALLGFLRNFFVSTLMRGEWGERVMRAFEQWGLIRGKLEGLVVGPIVGGAMVVLKHLCNGELNNSLFLMNEKSTLFPSALELALNSEDVGIKSESSRVIVNIIKTFSKGKVVHTLGSEREEQVRMRKEQMASDERVLKVLTGLLAAGQGVLVGEGVLGLILLVRECGAVETVTEAVLSERALLKLLGFIQSGTLQPLPSEPEEASITDLSNPESNVSESTAPTAKPPATLPLEIKANVCTLLIAVAPSQRHEREEDGRSRAEIMRLEGFVGKVKEGLLEENLKKVLDVWRK